MALSARMETSREAPHGFALLPHPAQGSLSAAAAAFPPPPPPLRPEEPPRGRPCPDPGLLGVLLGLALLQVGLGSALVALSFAMVWLSSAGQTKNACSAWAGASAMLCGILALTKWKKSVMIFNKLFILLSIICIPLSLTGLILGCQGIEFVSRVPRCDLMDKENKICFCCEELKAQNVETKCTEVETILKLYHVKSCSSAHLLLKKVLLGLCVLNALIATVCLTVVALHYWQIFASRRSCLGELHIEDHNDILDPDDFVPPVPPPSYFAACNSGPPQMTNRTFVSDGLSLPHVYAMHMNGAEVFFRVDPPPYEDEQSSNISEQGDALRINVMECVDSAEESEDQDSQAEEFYISSSRASFSPSNASCRPAGVNRRPLSPLQKQSKSNSVLLHHHLPQGTVLKCETATHSNIKQPMLSSCRRVQEQEL